MSRRVDSAAAESAAAAAAEAARVLQARQQEVRQAKEEPKAEPKQEPKPKKDIGISMSEERASELRRNNPGDKAREALAARREPEEQDEIEEAAVAAEAPAPAAPPVPEAPKTVKQTVDGQDYEVSEAEIEEAGGAKAWRLQKASENRLAKANEVLATAQRAYAAAPKEPEKPKETDQQFIAAKMDIIRYGSPEEAATAQIEIQQRLSRPVDPNAIMHQTLANMRFDTAEAQFKREHADLLTVPLVAKLVETLKAEEVRKHMPGGTPNWQAIAGVDWIGFFNTMANQVRSAVGRPSQPSTTPTAAAGTPSQQPDKEARKASIVNLPTAAARAEGPKEEKSLSPEEERKQAIAEMKAARGQRY